MFGYFADSPLIRDDFQGLEIRLPPISNARPDGAAFPGSEAKARVPAQGLDANGRRFPRSGSTLGTGFQGLENRLAGAAPWGLAALAGIALSAIAAAETPLIVVRPVKNAATHAWLRRRLDDPDPVHRGEALDALARIGDPRDADAIRARVEDPDARVRAEALRALATRGEALAEEMLARLVRDASPLVRDGVFRWTPAATFRVRPELVEHGLRDPAPEVRAAAARHAAALGAPPERLVRRMLEESDAAARVAWLRGLAAGGGAWREGALRAALAAHDDPPLLQAALEGITPEDVAFAEVVARHAATARGAMAAAAIAALGRLRPPSADDILARRLTEENDPSLWPLLCDALGEIGTPRAVEALTDELRRRRGYTVQSAALCALGRVGLVETVSALAVAAEDPHPGIRALAAEQLGMRSDQPDAAARPLWAMLDDTDDGVIAAALEALVRLGAPRTGARWDRLEALSSHEHPRIVAGVIRVRGALGDRSILPELVRRLHRIPADSPAEPRAAALDALMALDHGGETRRAIELVAKAVVPPSQFRPKPTPDAIETRRAALRYLERFGDATAAQTLLAAFDELPPAELRVDIARTVSRLTGQRYRAMPDYRYVSYSIESLEPPDHPPQPAKPGVELE